MLNTMFYTLLFSDSNFVSDYWFYFAIYLALMIVVIAAGVSFGVTTHRLEKQNEKIIELLTQIANK